MTTPMTLLCDTAPSPAVPTTSMPAQRQPRDVQAMLARIAELENQVATLEQALTTNRRIGAAIGVVMAMEKVTYEGAFDILKRASQHTNRKLRDIAEDVLLTGATAEHLTA
jgi:hypothetical protein